MSSEMKRIIHSILAFAFCGTGALLAEESKPAAPAEVKHAAAAEPKIYAVTDLVNLKPLIGQKITVDGMVLSTSANKTGTMRFLNFTKNYHESLSLVFFANMGGGTFTKEKLSGFAGRKIRVTGTLGEFNGNLQFKMESLDQIKIQP